MENNKRQSHWLFLFQEKLIKSKQFTLLFFLFLTILFPLLGFANLTSNTIYNSRNSFFQNSISKLTSIVLEQAKFEIKQSAISGQSLGLSSSFIISNLLKKRDGKIVTKDIKKELSAFNMMMGGCSEASVIMVDLGGTPGFAQTDYLVTCGAPDTLALLLYTNAPNVIQNMTLNVKLPTGLEYGGFVSGDHAGMISAFDVRDVQNPVFTIPELTQDSFIVAYIGVRANCENSPKAAQYFVDYNVNYAYTDSMGITVLCEEDYTPTTEFNNSVKIPVLNTLSVSPEALSFTTLNQTKTHTVEISQDGINSYLDSFVFTIHNLDLSVGITIADIRANTTQIISYQYDMMAKELKMTIPGIAFQQNIDPLVRPPDDKFDTNERINIYIDYQMPECHVTPLQDISYSSSYNCKGIQCQDPSFKNGSLQQSPSFGPQLNTTAVITQQGGFCDDNIIVGITLASTVSDSIMGMFENMTVQLSNCSQDNVSIAKLTIGGTILPDSTYGIVGGFVEFYLTKLTSDPDGPGVGLEDFDGDGRFDDLPGGKTLNATVEFAMICPADPSACSAAGCDIFNIAVLADYNCGLSRSQVIDAVTPSVTFQYDSEMTYPNEEAIFTSVLGYKFPAFTNTLPATKTIQICYTATPENLTICDTATTHLEIDLKGRSYEVFNGVISNVIFEGDTTNNFTFEDDTLTNTRTFIINEGNSQNSVQLCYQFDLTFDTCVCAPPTYLSLDAKVIEECGGGCSCTLSKGCGSTLLYTDPYCTGCSCDIMSTLDVNRLSTGYTDKTLTNKLDTSQIDPMDKNRFLPGDTAILNGTYEIMNEENVNLADFLLYFSFENRRIDYAETAEGTEGMKALFDPTAMKLLKFEYIPAATGIPIDISSLMCTDDVPEDTYEGLWVYGPHRNYEDACPVESVFPNVNPFNVSSSSSSDEFDGYSLRLHFWNWDMITKSIHPNWEIYSGDCLTPMLDLLGGPMQNGDKFKVSVSVPLVNNPVYDPAKEVAQFFRTYSYGQTYDNDAGINIVVATPCITPFPFEFHNPGITVENKLNLNDCGGEITHTFKVSNPPPANWFQNEYRPILGISQFYSDIPDPLLYNSGASVIDVNGNTKTLTLDSTGFNPIMANYNGVDYFTTNTSSENKMRLIFKDAELKNGIENSYDCTIADTKISGGGTIPLLGVGLNNDDSIVVKIPFERLCTDPVDLTDLEVSFDYAFPYLPDLNHVNWYCHGNSHSRGSCDPADPATHGEFYWADRTRDSRTNPNFNSDTTNVYQVTDSSNTFPTLTAMVTAGILVDIFGASETNTYDVCAGAVGGGTHTNVVTSITVPNSISLLNVSGGSGGYILVKSTDSTKIYSVDLPDLSATDCVTLTIETEQLFCTTEPDDSKVCLATSSGCMTTAKSSAILGQLGGNTCASAGACYFYDVKESDIQAEWMIEPVGEVELCDTVEYGVRVKNVKTSQLNSLITQWWLPKGLIPVAGSWQFAYPHGPTNQTAFANISDPIRNAAEDGVYGIGYTYADDADFSSYIDANGLIGVGVNTALTDSNQFVIKFRATTICDTFVSGSELRFRVNASGACEATVNSGIVQTQQQIIQGANPIDYAQILTIVDPLNMNCGAATTPMSITGLNVSETGQTQNSKMTLTLPTGMDYAGGGVTFLAPSNFTPSNFTSTNLGNATQLVFDLPDGIGPSAFFQIQIMVSINEMLGCGNADMGVDVTSFLPTNSCFMGPNCGVYVRNTVNPTTPILIKPPLNSDNLKVVSLCENEPDSVSLQYSFNLSNPGTITYNDTVTIEIIQDLNGNLKADNFEPALATGIEIINVAAGDTTAILGSFILPEAGSCPSILKLSYNTACVCKTNEIIIDKVEPQFFDELGDKQVLCPGQDLKFPVCGDFTFSLSPATAGNITVGMDSVTVAINPGEATITPIFLNISGSQAACEFDYVLPIYVADPFDIGPYAAQEICENSCTKLDLNLPGSWEGNVSIQWTPATYLDDPTSETPEICNPLGNITYAITVSNNDGDCIANANYQVIVNPLGVVGLAISGAQNCYKFSAPRRLTATTGFDNYSFYKLVNGTEIPVQSGTDNEYLPPANSNQTYIVKAKNNSDPCPSLSPSIILSPLDTCPSLGNLVWIDLNNNGLVDTAENGVANVELVLFGLGGDGLKGGGDDIEIARDTTDANGNYLFTDLDPNDYYVKVDSGIPSGYISATGTGIDGNDNSNYEPAVDPDNDINNNDDGTQMILPNGSIMIMSEAITLSSNNEPTDDGDNSVDSNLSLDFGLFKPNCETITNLITDRTICSGQLVDSFAVLTSFTNPDSIAFVYFTSPQTDSTVIYTTGIGIDTIPIQSGNDTVSLTNVSGLTAIGTAPDTFYIYAIAYPIPHFYTCRPYQEILLIVNSCDWGDLPDTSSFTNNADYQTLSANNGPVHIIKSGLNLGSLIDREPDGQPDNNALGEGVDDDGLTIFSTLDLAPGITFHLPLSAINMTGDTAYIEAWLDWNGDGDFDDPNEMVVDYKDNADGVFPAFMEITIPVNALIGSLLGLRVRLSNTDNMTPYGKINSGEIEDYLIGIDCSQVICIPVSVTIKKG